VEQELVDFVPGTSVRGMHVDTASAVPVRERQPPARTNMHNNAISVNSMHRIRSAQDLALYNLTLSEEIDGISTAQRTSRPGTPTSVAGSHETAEQLTGISLVRGDLRGQTSSRTAGRELFPQQPRPAGAPTNGDFRHAHR